VALLWGRPFLGQLRQTPALEHSSFLRALATEYNKVALDYWQMLYAEGIWHWLADRKSNYLDPLLNLSPVNPVLYIIALVLYAGGFLGAVLGLKHKENRYNALAIIGAALLPGIIVVLGNVLKPGTFRMHGRHLYPVAPFFYLLMAYGWSEWVPRWRNSAAERPAKTPVENAACKL